MAFSFAQSIDRVLYTASTESGSVSGCNGDYFSLVYIESGRGRMKDGTSEHSFFAKCLILIPEKCEYSLIFDSESKGNTVLSVKRTELPPELAAALSVFDGGITVISSEKLSFEITSLLERIKAAKASVNDEDIYISLMTLELILLLSKADATDGKSDTLTLGARVEKFLSENLDTETDLDSLARRFFVSKYYLCRAFKRHTGMTLHSYITTKRLIRARELIGGGEAASSVAYKVGFGDYSAFYRAYVKLFGSSPTEKNTKGKGYGL